MFFCFFFWTFISFIFFAVFKKYTKRLSRFISAKTQKKMIFISTLSEFSEYINVAELQLPKSTLAIETDLTENGSTYQPVLKVSQFYAHGTRSTDFFNMV